MTLDKLISLLAEAAVQKLSREREAKDAAPDAISYAYTHFQCFARSIWDRSKRNPNAFGRL